MNPKDGAAVQMVTRMDALFLVDRHAREQQLGAEDRGALRREHARRDGGDSLSASALRSQVLPKKCWAKPNYTLNMWQKLRRCFDHDEVELSNNVAENSMRPVTLGRKNWLHVEAQDWPGKNGDFISGGNLCRRLGVPVKEYLLAVLPEERRKVTEVAQLTPARWAAARSRPGMVVRIPSVRIYLADAEQRVKITQTDNISGEQVVHSYDSLNRLASAGAQQAWRVPLRQVMDQ